MSKSDEIRLRHMHDAACKILAFTQDRTREDLDTDELLALATVRLIEILGEAAKNVSPSIREQTCKHDRNLTQWHSLCDNQTAIACWLESARTTLALALCLNLSSLLKPYPSGRHRGTDSIQRQNTPHGTARVSVIASDPHSI